MPESRSAFEHWVRAVGLPLHFPRLDAVEFGIPSVGKQADIDDRFYFGQPHEELIEAAIQSLAQPSLANLVPDGHGVTTLARYVYHRSASEASVRSLIPVSLSLEDLILDNDINALWTGLVERDVIVARKSGRYGNLLSLASALPADENTREHAAEKAFTSITQERIEEALDKAIEHAIVTSMVSEPWERIITRSFYADLIGAPNTATAELEKRRHQLHGLLVGGGDPAEVFAGTRLVGPWTDVMPELHAYNVRLSLQFDLSPSPIGRYYVSGEGERLTYAYTDALMAFATAVKNIDQRANARYMNWAYFLSPPAWTTFESQVVRRAERTDFPAYSQLDVFTILAVHFPRSTAGKKDRKDDLAAVLDSSLIDHADGRALTTMIGDLSLLLRRMDMRDLRFQLTRSYEGIFGVGLGLTELEEWREDVDRRLRALENQVRGLGERGS